MRPKLILASASPFRRQLLENAGLTFETIRAEIDERAVEAPMTRQHAPPEEIAEALAKAKALNVSVDNLDALVIGSDQIMSMDGVIYHKCRSLDEARLRLLSMRNKTHYLDSALAITQGDRLLWSHVSRAQMTLRNFDEAFIDAYLEKAGADVLASVGAYQYEGEGIQLFEKIEGDYFAIIGLPLLPLLHALRELGAINA